MCEGDDVEEGGQKVWILAWRHLWMPLGLFNFNNCCVFRPPNRGIARHLLIWFFLILHQCDQVFHWKNRQLLVKNRQICRHSNKVIFQTPKGLHQSFTKKFFLEIFRKKIVAKDLQKSPKWRQIATSGHTGIKTELSRSTVTSWRGSI